ncbi:MAG: low molecular weight phosphotyrosine protein phosphatase [Solirubrobacterales bacterium]|nr:low molecular weight phosphotyrosine protein phosphatase [Thermoleophilales bacterium]MCO5326029.1 low molecular weight phosphotyrosine protein phosphatase [Solirubrobacterales bacterium]
MRILCVCLGNICRSPTAEGVLRHRLREAGLGEDVDVESAGTGGWHVGHRPDERASAAASARGITLESRAQRFEVDHFDDFDLILAMDRQNLADMRALAPHADAEGKLRILREWDPEARGDSDLDVPDPYYGGEQGFEDVLDMIERSCDALVEEILATRFPGSRD